MIKNINLTLMLIMVVAMTAPLMGTTYVVPSGTASITDALNAAAGNGTGVTDYIDIENGYSPSVETSFPILINTDNLIIETKPGEANQSLLYNPNSIGAYPGGANQGEDFFHLGAVTQVTIQNLKFGNYNSPTSNNWYNCSFAITDKPWGNSDPSNADPKTVIKILNNTFQHCRNSGDTLAANKYGYDGGAVHLSKISNSQVSGNTIQNCGEGIALYISNLNIVHDNDITGNYQFGIRLNTEFNSNSIDYNNVSDCQDRGIILYDAQDWFNVSHYIGWNNVEGCSAEGILVVGSGNPDTGQNQGNPQYSHIEYNCVHDNCLSGFYPSIMDYDDDGDCSNNDDPPAYGSSSTWTPDTNYTNYAGIALHTCANIYLSFNTVWNNGELGNFPHTCFGGLAMLNSKVIIIERNVFYGNTGDFEYNQNQTPPNDNGCAVFLVYNHCNYITTPPHWAQDDASGSHMSYNDIYYQFNDSPVQYWGAENTSAESCFSAQHNYWDNPNGPNDPIEGGCQWEYNVNPNHPRVDQHITWSEYEGSSTAIELKEFSATPYTDKSIKCEWSTGTEQNNAGYYIVKSEFTNKGYTLVNNNIIPATGDTVSGGNYSFVDNHIAPYTLYYYWLVDVDYDGTLTIHGPVSAVYESDDSYWESLSLR